MNTPRPTTLTALLRLRATTGERVRDLHVEPGGADWPVRAASGDGWIRRARWTSDGLVLGDPVPLEGLVALRAQMLDRQIVDVEGHRVVRVGDIVLAKSDGSLAAVALEVGIAPVLQRLGLGVLARGAPDLMRLEHVTVDDACLVAHVPRERIEKIETHHLARLIRRLPHRVAPRVLAGLPPHREREVHEHIARHPHRPRLRRYRASRHA